MFYQHFCAFTDYAHLVAATLDNHQQVHKALQVVAESEDTHDSAKLLSEVHSLTSLRPLAPSILNESAAMISAATQAAKEAHSQLSATVKAHTAAKKATQLRLERQLQVD
jgi:hypothetical protein